MGFDRSSINENSNSTVDRKERRKLLKCSFCPPHSNENASRYGKHGKTKRKYKRVRLKKER